MTSTELDTTESTDDRESSHADDAHRELTQLSAYVLRTVLNTLTTQPMMAATLGPGFVEEATAVANRLGELLAVVNPAFADPVDNG